METNETHAEITVDRRAVVCAARHYIAAYDSAYKDKPIDFEAICANCEELSRCQEDWLGAAAPLFEAAGIYPHIDWGPLEPASGIVHRIPRIPPGYNQPGDDKENSPAAATAEEDSCGKDATQDNIEDRYRLSVMGETYLEILSLRCWVRFQSVLLGLVAGALIGLFWIILSNL